MRTFKKMICFICFICCAISNAQTSLNDRSTLAIDPETNCYIRYYYYPNLGCYYDNLDLVYHYKLNGQWEKSEELPTNYGGYSLFKNVKIAITDFDGEEPFQCIQVHKKMYPYSSKGRFKNNSISATNLVSE